MGTINLSTFSIQAIDDVNIFLSFSFDILDSTFIGLYLYLLHNEYVILSHIVDFKGSSSSDLSRNRHDFVVES